MIIAFVRTIVLYLFIIAGIRLMGKRQVGELEPSELVLALIIADLAAVPMQDFGIPLITGAVPIITLLCVTLLISLLTMRSIRFRAVVCGKPSVVINDGKLCQEEMRKNRFTLDELTEELRVQGVADLRSVRYAILETNGQLTVLLKTAEAPVTASQLGLSPADPGLSTLIISDGRLMAENLERRGLNRAWLDNELKRHHAANVREVFALWVDELGKVFFVKKEARK